MLPMFWFHLKSVRISDSLTHCSSTVTLMDVRFLMMTSKRFLNSSCRPGAMEFNHAWSCMHWLNMIQFKGHPIIFASSCYRKSS